MKYSGSVIEAKGTGSRSRSLAEVIRASTWRAQALKTPCCPTVSHEEKCDCDVFEAGNASARYLMPRSPRRADPTHVRLPGFQLRRHRRIRLCSAVDPGNAPAVAHFSLFPKPTTYDSIVGCVNQFEFLMHNLSIALDASLRMFSDHVNGGRKG